ncbi:MAG: hypothetical protein U9R57_02775 [Thermodesulfobacteriota bacterium]|nr:hypothetical protein [Thermodesulfobacteriota bacterium]
MILLSGFIRKNLFPCLLFFIFVMLYAASSLGAVLNPFPTRERAPQYQQSSPGYRQVQSPQELGQFRQEIAGFQCPELRALKVQLQNQYKTAVAKDDKEYYRRFLNELYREMYNKSCKN